MSQSVPPPRSGTQSRRADRVPTQGRGPLARLLDHAVARTSAGVTALGQSRVPLGAWVVLVVAGATALILPMIPIGPPWLGDAGAVTVAAAYSWALAARTGGRPVVFGSLALLVGAVVLVTDQEQLRTGAAVMTCVIGAVLAVMATVPAVQFRHAARETVVAVVVAAVGGLAAVGFEPQVALVRFEYATFGLALVGALVVVYRLGAGLHGLGTRGLLIVVVGGILVLVTVLYAELLRRYGTPGLVDALTDGVRWSRDNLGAFPRPIETVLGIPALAYGCHMRARRRQGWWVCAFGVAGTAAVANSLANPAIALSEVALSGTYGLVGGLILGYVVIRADLAVTGSRGRRSREAEEAAAIRPEPRRWQPLL